MKNKRFLWVLKGVKKISANGFSLSQIFIGDSLWFIRFVLDHYFGLLVLVSSCILLLTLESQLVSFSVQSVSSLVHSVLVLVRLLHDPGSVRVDLDSLQKFGSLSVNDLHWLALLFSDQVNIGWGRSRGGGGVLRLGFLVVLLPLSNFLLVGFSQLEELFLTLFLELMSFFKILFFDLVDLLLVVSEDLVFLLLGWFLELRLVLVFSNLIGRESLGLIENELERAEIEEIIEVTSGVREEGVSEEGIVVVEEWSNHFFFWRVTLYILKTFNI